MIIIRSQEAITRYMRTGMNSHIYGNMAVITNSKENRITKYDVDMYTFFSKLEVLEIHEDYTKSRRK